MLFQGHFGTAGIGLQGPAETSREKAEDEQNPWEEYRTAAESAKLSVELAAKAAEEARELFARELRISVIIPSKDNPSVLGKCLRSLTQRPEGSVPVEILQKVGAMGCSVLIAKSAPTNYSCRLAQQLGITLIGFARDETFNIYSHPERIL